MIIPVNNLCCQEMLNTAECYVKEYSISFSANMDPGKSKTKGIIFSRKPLKIEPENLKLNGNPPALSPKSKVSGK